MYELIKTEKGFVAIATDTTEIKVDDWYISDTNQIISSIDIDSFCSYRRNYYKIVASTFFIDKKVPIWKNDTYNIGKDLIKEIKDSIRFETKEILLAKYENCEFKKEVGCIKDICNCYKLILKTTKDELGQLWCNIINKQI